MYTVELTAKAKKLHKATFPNHSLLLCNQEMYRSKEIYIVFIPLEFLAVQLNHIICRNIHSTVISYRATSNSYRYATMF